MLSKVAVLSIFHFGLYGKKVKLNDTLDVKNIIKNELKVTRGHSRSRTTKNDGL